MIYSKDIHIFTDLDGSLINHYDYSFEAALSIIEKLNRLRIGVSLCTSKTLDEVLLWQSRLNLMSPFVIENGSAIFFPKKELLTICDETIEITGADGLQSRVLGAELDKIEHVLDPFRNRLISFLHSTTEEAANMTGLSLEEAKRAQARKYSFPLLIKDSKCHEDLTEAARSNGLRLIRGGRFYHLQGDCDKSDGMTLISDLFGEARQRRPTTIAIGDDENDREMLLKADVAVVVKRTGRYFAVLNKKNIIYTDDMAPNGWVEGVIRALKYLGLEDMEWETISKQVG